MTGQLAMVRRAKVLTRRTDDFAVACTVDGRCIEMSGTARLIWLSLPDHDEPALPISQLVADLAEIYEVDVDVIADDVATAIAQFVDSGCATAVD